MRKFNKLIVVVAALAMMASLAGCTKKENPGDTQTDVEISTEDVTQTEDQVADGTDGTDVESEDGGEATEESEPEQMTLLDKVIYGSEDGVVVETAYFYVTLPSDWEEDVDTEISFLDEGRYSLSVRDKVNYDAGFGGNLFSLVVLADKDDCEVFPDYEEIGEIVTADATYYLIASFPTDVQFDMESAEHYQNMYDKVEDIVKNVEIK